ncbi:MAG: OmpA family protein [Alphaproteobacteria bacterium]|nr:OmpA family protein [Alphaproteobacteria bacterium]
MNCDSATLYFELDSSALRSEDRAKLGEMAPCLSKRPGRVRLEGHCDSRGTTEYNLALGQRRADSVRDYLIGLGVSPDRLSTISYGEERPAVTGSGEGVWAKNRRVELKVTN